MGLGQLGRQATGPVTKRADAIVLVFGDGRVRPPALSKRLHGGGLGAGPQIIPEFASLRQQFAGLSQVAARS